MDRPKEVTRVAAVMCLFGAFQIGWGALTFELAASEFLDGYVPYQIRQLGTYTMPAYVACTALSFALAFVLGTWAIYIAARTVVADKRALINMPPWRRSVWSFVVGSFVISILVMFHDHPSWRNMVWGPRPAYILSFASGFSEATCIDLIVAYIVIHYTESRLGRDHVTEWFAAAARAHEIPEDVVGPPSSSSPNPSDSGDTTPS